MSTIEWYYKFELTKSKVPSDVHNPFYVQRSDNAGHRFAWFKSPLEFFGYERSTPRSHRNFFETVMGDVPQKPHFDVDIKLSELGEFASDTIIIDELIYAILDYTTAMGTPIDITRDLRIYSSHGIDKRSYHVVLPNWYHAKHTEAKSFYGSIVGKMPIPHRKFIDKGVYSKLQEFRMLGSTKFGANRHKAPVTTWNLGDTAITFPLDQLTPEDVFLESLLTYVDLTKSKLMPVEQNGAVVVSGVTYSALGNSIVQNVDDVTLREAISKLPNYYRYVGWNGSYHRLERVRGNEECIVCKRPHGTDSKGDNGYMVIREDAIYLHCFRNTSQPMLLAVKKKDTWHSLAEDATYISMESTSTTTKPLTMDDALIIFKSKNVSNPKAKPKPRPKTSNAELVLQHLKKLRKD